MRSRMTIAALALCAVALASAACGAETSGDDGASAASAYAQDPATTSAQLYYWDESGERYPLSEVLANDNLYACLEDACLGEGYLVWMAAAWVVSVGSAWYVTNNHQRVGPFASRSSAEGAVTAARTAKKRRTYECTTTCQSNGSDRGAYYVSGSSTTDCATATLDAKSRIPRGEYPRHCSCADTEGFRGTGTQCENHVRR